MSAPTFTLKNHEGNDIRLPEKGTVVLYFYPKADTPGCTKEGKTFTELYPDFIKAGALVLGVSPDPVDKIKKFCDKYGFAHALLSDPDHAVAEKYGAWGKKQMYGKEYEGILRKTYLIQDGKIVQTWEKHRPGKTEQEVLEAVQELE